MVKSNFLIFLLTFAFQAISAAAPKGICLFAYGPDAPADKIECFEFEKIETYDGEKHYYQKNGKSSIVTSYRNRGLIYYADESTDPAKTLATYEALAQQTPSTRPFLNPKILQLRNNLSEAAKQAQAITELPTITLPDGRVLKGCRATKIEGSSVTIVHSDGIKKIEISDLSSNLKVALHLASLPKTDLDTPAATEPTPNKTPDWSRNEPDALATTKTPSIKKEVDDPPQIDTPSGNTGNNPKNEGLSTSQKTSDSESKHSKISKIEKPNPDILHSLISRGISDGLDSKTVEEMKSCQRNAINGDIQSQLHMGHLFFHDNIKIYKEGVKWFALAADQGNAEAQGLLGTCYEEGIGITKDYAEALRWYRKSAEQEYPEAECQLGYCYSNGKGVVKDDVEAAKWFLKSANKGFSKAQCQLGLFYDSGTGVVEDHVEAYKWMLLSAAQGYLMAKKLLIVIPEKLSPADRAKGERLASEWRPSLLKGGNVIDQAQAKAELGSISHNPDQVVESNTLPQNKKSFWSIVTSGPFVFLAFFGCIACLIFGIKRMKRSRSSSTLVNSPQNPIEQTGGIVIKFFCPHCAVKIAAESSQCGTSATCPSCGNAFVVPSDEIKGEPPLQDGISPLPKEQPDPTTSNTITELPREILKSPNITAIKESEPEILGTVLPEPIVHTFSNPPPLPTEQNCRAKDAPHTFENPPPLPSAQ